MNTMERRYLSAGPIGRIWTRRLRPMAVATLIVFGWSAGQPWNYAAAMQLQATTAAQPSEAELDLAAFDQALRRLQARVERLDEKIDQGPGDLAADLAALDEPWAEIAALAPEIRDEMDRIGDHLRSADVPQEIRQRHHDAVQAFAADLRRLEDGIKDAKRLHGEFADARARGRSDEAAARFKDLGAKIKEARGHLRDKIARERHTPVDPNRLPHRGSDLKRRAPRTDAAAFADLAASAGPAEAATAPVLSLQARAAVPGPQDLAPTLDAPQTPEVQALAASLGNHPLRIFEWVRNQIDFTPTHGSIQGAQGCLQSRLCNDLDTASLLIALLRSAGVPARYALGTVEVPIEQMKGWAGDFTDADAALDFVASGGTAVTGLTDAAGTLVAARVEHAWVEAFLDYIPSRAAVPGAAGDTWVPLDPSFKETVLTPGLDLAAATDADPVDFFRGLIEGAVIADPDGAVTGIDIAAIEAERAEIRNDIEAYIDNLPEAPTAGDLMGRREIAAQTLPAAPASLPYRVIVRGAGFSTVPDTLRHRVSFAVFGDDRFAFDPDFTFQARLPELATRKITLSYAPATAADQATLLSLVPASGNPADLPSTLPAYLIRVKPELRIDGELVATGQPVTLGQPGRFRMTFGQPGDGPRVIDNDLTAGTFNAVVLNLGRVGDPEGRKARAAALRDRIQGGDASGVTKEDVLGEILHAAGLLYWAETDLYARIAADQKNVATARLPSEGIFTYDFQVSFLFGMPRTVRSGALATDVDADVQAVIARDGDRQKTIDYMAVTGAFSSRAESSVWDQLMSPAPTGRGIDTMSYLESAVRQGIPLYHITRDNVAAALPKLQVSAAIKADIQSAVAAGKEVTIPQREFAKDGFQGIGYVVFDPETGAAGYLISGGLAGGGFRLPQPHPLVNFGIGALLAVLGLIFATGFLGVLVLLAAIAFIAYDFLSSVDNLPEDLSPEAREMVVGFLAALAVIGVLLAIIGFFAGPIAFAVLVGMYWAVASLIASNAIGPLASWLENLLENRGGTAAPPGLPLRTATAAS